MNANGVFRRFLWASIAVLLSALLWFAYGIISVVHELNSAAAYLESLGAEVNGIFWAPKYIYFGHETDDATMELAQPSLTKLWTVDEVHLTDTQITDHGLANLSVMHNLRRVVLTRTAVTDQGIEDLSGRFPNAEIAR